MQVYKKKVVPILKEADVRYQTIETEYAGHAKDLIKNLNLSEIRGIVVVSGDGLVFEVINGLMEREDKFVAIKVPIGVIPGGSGNALICSVLYQAGYYFFESNSESYLHNIVLTSTLFVIKNRTEPMDLVTVETSSNKTLYSILSVAWGIVADVDIESEMYRYLGKARFTVGAIKRIVNLRKYKGTLSFLPCSNDDDTSTKPPADQNGKTFDSHRPAYAPNSLTTPVPDNWTKISANDFVSVVAMYQTHLAQDMKCIPSSKLQDGCIYLNVIKGNVSRAKMLHYFNSMEDGTLETISDPYCNIYKVKAFRIEPSDDITSGIMTVDGERVQFGSIQGWVNEGMCRVMKA
ncbi:hypothetical protein HELRODRAFT_106711 [Helobdella robusta]|uniref:DAGKc domain-containing protein n=1 Tax=Helobdella robusta TaxID=6412 RepID=T1EE40_HELRO|nr:hypothetical protein HELRODRAFT_106711 [Helobdella robusta]ESO02544.1 hypothetical protein HELRODRAFT_106711 [Helobdella robusta]